MTQTHTLPFIPPHYSDGTKLARDPADGWTVMAMLRKESRYDHLYRNDHRGAQWR